MGTSSFTLSWCVVYKRSSIFHHWLIMKNVNEEKRRDGVSRVHNGHSFFSLLYEFLGNLGWWSMYVVLKELFDIRYSLCLYKLWLSSIILVKQSYIHIQIFSLKVPGHHWLPFKVESGEDNFPIWEITNFFLNHVTSFNLTPKFNLTK